MAGRVQLATTGLRDKFFVDDPEFSYFNRVFQKTSNFARETIEIDPLSTPEFGSITRFRIRQDQGHFLSCVSLKLKLPPLPNRIPTGGTQYATGWIDSVAHALVEYVEIQIGEVPIQRLSSDYLAIHSEHEVTQTHQHTLKHLVGKFPTRIASLWAQHKSIQGHLGRAGESTEFYVDVPFWFYREPTLAIPLAALKEQEIDIIVKLRDIDRLVVSSNQYVDWAARPPKPEGLQIESLTLDAEIVFVDEADVIRLKNSVTDYVITQIQEANFTVDPGQTSGRFRTQFVNPVKELFFIVQREDKKGLLNYCAPHDYDNIRDDPGTEYGKYTDDGKLVLWENVDSISIKLDSDEILNEKTGRAAFLKAVQGGIHHKKTQLIRRFYSYAFCTQPEISAPTGSVNFTPIVSQVFDFKLHNNPHYRRDVRILAKSYNVLRVDGRAGFARVLFNNN